MTSNTGKGEHKCADRKNMQIDKESMQIEKCVLAQVVPTKQHTWGGREWEIQAQHGWSLVKATSGLDDHHSVTVFTHSFPP